MANEDRMEIMKELQWRGRTHNCPECEGLAFCALEAGQSSNLCWCMTVDKPYNPDTQYTQCLCRCCLTQGE